jgi:hypothetical protein
MIQRFKNSTIYLRKKSEVKKSKISNSKIQRFFPEENQELGIRNHVMTETWSDRKDVQNTLQLTIKLSMWSLHCDAKHTNRRIFQCKTPNFHCALHAGWIESPFRRCGTTDRLKL